jgi:4'-phosphopantetheinyl transferase
MLFIQEKLSEGFTLGIWKVEETTEQILQMLQQQDWYLPYLSTISHEGRKKEWLAVRVLLKQLCGEEKKIAYNGNGSPYLEDNTFNISISHTKGYVAVLLHPVNNPGLDIERVNERILYLKHKFLRDEEQQQICGNNEQTLATLLWSAKESLFKVLNAEGVDFREHLFIHDFLLQDEGVFDAEESRTGDMKKFIVRYKVFQDFVLTWTSVNE